LATEGVFYAYNDTQTSHRGPADRATAPSHTVVSPSDGTSAKEDRFARERLIASIRFDARFTALVE
jgi:hypothetical protein